jgi:hypothetical protein
METQPPAHCRQANKAEEQDCRAPGDAADQQAEAAVN